MSKMILVFISSCPALLAQARRIELNFTHSRRIANQTVYISIQEMGSICLATVSIAEKSDKAKTSYKKEIKKELFGKLFEKLSQLKMEAIQSKILRGKDGTDCTLTFGDTKSLISIQIWTPDYDTKKRELDGFLTTFKMILEAGGLNPGEIL